MKPRHFLWLILFLALALRLWGLGSMETFHDEGFYAFRSIGYLDFIQNDDQTTPIQWFKDTALPWWTSLSFHDHPPLFFFIQNIFFRIFGDSLFVARLPSVFAGTAAIYLVYLLGKQFFSAGGGSAFGGKNEYAGLLGALLLSINQIHIWISRSSLMESVLIVLILLNIYAFFRFIDDRRRWPLFGITLGLIALTKYIGVFIVPVYIIYLIWGLRESNGLPKSKILKDWRLYAAFGLALLLFSPVLIYNFYLYQTTGHFDLQFAYLFGQETPEWQASMGKIQEPFSNIIANLTAVYSIPFLLVVLGGLVYSFWLWIKKRYPLLIFSWLSILFITLMLVAAGSAYRFIVLYTAPFVFFALIFFVGILGDRMSLILRNFWTSDLLDIKKILLVAFLAYESFFAINGIFITYPDFGIVKLDRYFDGIFANERPLSIPKSPNPHLDKIIQRNLAGYPQTEKMITIIYDENINLSSKLWIFARRLYYHGIPSVTAGHFKSLLQSKGIEYFKDYEIYFVRTTAYTSLNPYFSTPDAFELENFLQQELGLSPIEIIYGYDSLPMFKVYKFLL